MKRDLINSTDFSKEEILHIFDLARNFKANKGKSTDELKGKSIGLIFQKPSNRTRVSFEVGIFQMGGNCIYLGPEEINLGKRETTHDVAQTLSRYLDGIVARVFLHQDVVDLAKYASIPIINGLCDLDHPCQALTDIFSVQEKFGNLKNVTIAYVGDANNVCNGLMFVCAQLGMHMNIAAPKGYQPLPDVMKKVQVLCKRSGSKIVLMTNPKEAVKGVQVIYADTWVSMGQESETKKRLKDLKDYQVNAQLTKLADKNFIFMHCLPAHRGQEVTDDVIDGKHSIIFDEAENRLHVQKAVLKFLFSKG